MADSQGTGSLPPARESEPRPNFETCGNCGADAAKHVYWNITGGWSCRACGESDYPEAAS